MNAPVEVSGSLAAHPVVVSVNVDVETVDSENAGPAGLFGRYSYGRYGAREGIWRLLNVFEDQGVKATFFLSADDAARHAPIVEAILSAGHELAAQSVVVEPADPRSAARLESLAKEREVFQRLTGCPPAGWRAGNGLVTADVLRELGRLGYLYESSFQDDDEPYLFDCGDGRSLMELPVFDYLTDATFYRARHTPERVAKVWREEAAAMCEAGGYLHLTLHSRGDIGSGRGVRAGRVAEFLRHLAGRSGVAFYRCSDLADLYRRRAAPPEPIPDWPLHPA